jgi:hypothetical protein
MAITQLNEGVFWILAIEIYNFKLVLRFDVNDLGLILLFDIKVILESVHYDISWHYFNNLSPAKASLTIFKLNAKIRKALLMSMVLLVRRCRKYLTSQALSSPIKYLGPF